MFLTCTKCEGPFLRYECPECGREGCVTAMQWCNNPIKHPGREAKYAYQTARLTKQLSL